jgi:uncharacterized protein (UPF0335 family)
MTDINDNCSDIVNLARAWRELEEEKKEVTQRIAALKGGAKDLGIDVAAAGQLVKLSMMDDEKLARLAERNDVMRSYGEVLEIDPFPSNN